MMTGSPDRLMNTPYIKVWNNVPCKYKSYLIRSDLLEILQGQKQTEFPYVCQTKKGAVTYESNGFWYSLYMFY